MIKYPITFNIRYMNPAIKRMLLFTAGVVDIVGEKIKSIGESIKTEDALNPQEGRKVVSEVMQGASKKAEEVRTQVAQGAQVASHHMQRAGESVQKAADTAREAVHNATKPAPMPASTTTQNAESVVNAPAPMPVAPVAPVVEPAPATEPVMNSAEQLPTDMNPVS